MAEPVNDSPSDHPHRRALLKALAVAPVILTVSTVGARAAYGSMGNTRPECSNIMGLPADQIPPQCKIPPGLA
jgi:hypothetical protein